MGELVSPQVIEILLFACRHDQKPDLGFDFCSPEIAKCTFYVPVEPLKWSELVLDTLESSRWFFKGFLVSAMCKCSRKRADLRLGEVKPQRCFSKSKRFATKLLTGL